jgi:hypothetical protein
MKLIEEQFTSLYAYDADLRRLIPESDVGKLPLEDKYHILTAYMRGGIQAVLGEENDDEYVSKEEKEMIEEEFMHLYNTQPEFKAVLRGAHPKEVPLRDKYELIIAFSRRGEDNDDEVP